MGSDKILNFLVKNIGYNSIDKIYIDDDYDKGLYICNHIFFDIQFIIYICINLIEHDINYIIKILCGLLYNDKNNIRQIKYYFI